MARPKVGRSWHADTPFETVQTPEGVLLKKEAEARAQLQAQAQATPAADPGAARKTVPAVNVAWADLNAAVQAGWIRPEAAHALWARWLARKPLTHVEDDGSAVAPLPPLAPAPMAEAAPEPGQASAAPSASATPDASPSPSSPPVPEQAKGLASPAAEARRSAAAEESDPSSAHGLESRETEPDTIAGEALEDVSPTRRSREPEPAAAAPDAASHPEQDEAERAASPSPPPTAQPSPPSPPEAIDVEVLEPLEEANARRAAERAAQPAPVIQVTDVI